MSCDGGRAPCRFGPERADCRAGFTLVEMLVSITVLSLILLTTFSAIYGLGKTQSRLSDTTARLDEMRLVSKFLRSSLSQAFPVIPAESNRVFFHGTEDEIYWAAPLLVGGDRAGVNYCRLVRRGNTLYIQFSVYHPTGAMPDWEDIESHVLVEDIEELRIAYRGEGSEWWDQWGEDQSGLPRAVSLGIKAHQRRWPDLVVAPDLYRPSH